MNELLKELLNTLNTLGSAFFQNEHAPEMLKSISHAVCGFFRKLSGDFCTLFKLKSTYVFLSLIFLLGCVLIGTRLHQNTVDSIYSMVRADIRLCVCCSQNQDDSSGGLLPCIPLKKNIPATD